MNECLSNLDTYMPYFDGDSDRFLYLMNVYVIHSVYNTSFGDLVPLIMSNALNEIIVILEKNTSGYRVTVMTPHNSDHSIDHNGRNRRLYLFKHMDHYHACVPLHYNGLCDLSRIDKSDSAYNVAASIPTWDSPHHDDRHHTFCHVCCNHKCTCSEEKYNDLLDESELIVDICSPSTNNKDGVPLSSHMNQSLYIDKTCDLNGTDDNVYKPITLVASANVPPIESAPYNPN